MKHMIHVFQTLHDQLTTMLDRELMLVSRTVVKNHKIGIQ